MAKPAVLTAPGNRPHTAKPESGRRSIYTANEVDDILCVFEWMVDQFNVVRAYDNRSVAGIATDEPSSVARTVESLFDNIGWSGMRSVAAQAGVIVGEAWDICDQNGQLCTLTEGGVAFDWEFVPMICARLDWPQLANDNQFKTGTWKPDIRKMLASIVAERAMRVSAPTTT